MPLSPLVEEVFASALSGLACVTLGHPLDCIKVRQQTGGSARSALQIARQMLAEQGLSAFSRGMGPPLLSAVLMNTLMFVGFAEARRRMPAEIQASTAGALLAGALSGIATSYVSTPFDWLKVQAQVRGERTIQLFRATVTRSPSRLFTGHWANVAREGVFTAIYLGLYDRIRATFSPPGPDGVATHMPLAMVVAASASTGGLAWLACYPFDSVKTVQQATRSSDPPARSTLRGAIQALRGKGGWGAFYHGAGASVTRACIVTSSRIVAYEYAKAALRIV